MGTRVSSLNKTILKFREREQGRIKKKKNGGANIDRVAKGHSKGEGAGGGCKREAETASILQSYVKTIKNIISSSDIVPILFVSS